MTKKKLLLANRQKGVIKAVDGVLTDPSAGYTDPMSLYMKNNPNSIMAGGSGLSSPFGQTTSSPGIGGMPTQKSFSSGLGANISAAAPAITGGIGAAKAATNGASKVTGSAAGATAGGIAAGATIANMAGQYFIDKNKNEKVNEFGLVDPDEKAMKKSGALSGMATGASLGASLAVVNPLLGAIGAGVGALGGGIMGFFKGKKQGTEAQEEYDKKMVDANNSVVRQADAASSAALYTAKGAKFNMPKHSTAKLIPKYKSGGKLEEAGAVNIVPKGKLHKENNNLGNKDKGIPVINTAGVKEYEVEKEELILRLEATQRVEALVYEFNRTRNEEVLDQIGSYLSDELSSNTHDYTGKFKVKIVE